jgi:hypothetical protein
VFEKPSITPDPDACPGEFLTVLVMVRGLRTGDASRPNIRDYPPVVAIADQCRAHLSDGCCDVRPGYGALGGPGVLSAARCTVNTWPGWDPVR